MNGGGDAGDAMEAQADLSLSLMWSKCEMLECSWGEKEYKRRGAGHLCGGEKQENEMKRGRKWNERKKNNIKKILIEKYYHNIFAIFSQ